MAGRRGKVRVGTAGWNIPKLYASEFDPIGSHLERYAGSFSAVEINSSFYRTHRAKTYVRWAASVPDDFRFAVKAPREITHLRRLIDTKEILSGFLSDAQGLGRKLGPILIQLPPSFAFDGAVVRAFFKLLRRLCSSQIVCEPRHLTWFTPGVDVLLKDFEIARVAADPARAEDAKTPGGWDGLSYWRLHGSPEIYKSAYAQNELLTLADIFKRQRSEVWCIFDNTTFGKATENALKLSSMLGGRSG
jgi:uncharacterized protein YecE (DUF72 family)